MKFSAVSDSGLSTVAFRDCRCARNGLAWVLDAKFTQLEGRNGLYGWSFEVPYTAWFRF